MDPDQTAPIGAVCSVSTLFASILNLSVLFGNYLQQMTSADNIFRCIFFLGALRDKNVVRFLKFYLLFVIFLKMFQIVFALLIHCQNSCYYVGNK